MNDKSDLTFYLRNRKRQSLDKNNKVSDSEKSFRLGFRQVIRKFTFNTTIELAQTLDELSEQIAKLLRYSLSASFRPTPKHSFNANINYMNNADPTRITNRNLTIGLNISSKITKSTFVAFHYQTTNYLRFTTPVRDMVELRISQDLPNGHKIDLAARRQSMGSSIQPDLKSVSIEYRIPLGIPFGERKKFGTIKGRIFDKERGIPVGNAIVRLNALTTFSDKNGEFRFPSVIPGKGYLLFESPKDEIKLVSLQKMPYEINLLAGQEKWITIDVTRSASVSGQVVLFGYEKAETNRFLFQLEQKKNNLPGKKNEVDNLIKMNGLQNLLVEITNGKQTYRRITDIKGRYVFAELSTGKWTLSVNKQGLPEYHTFEKEQVNLDLKPGDSIIKDFKVLPKKRSIRVIHDGGNLRKK